MDGIDLDLYTSWVFSGPQVVIVIKTWSWVTSHLSSQINVWCLCSLHYITRQILDCDPRSDCPILHCESLATVLQNWVTPPAFMTTTPVPGQATEAGALTSRAQSKRQILLCLSGLQTYSDSRWYPFYNPFLG